MHALDKQVLEEVKDLSIQLASKISDPAPYPGKMVQGFLVAMVHEDGTVAVDHIGYLDFEKLKSRIETHLQFQINARFRAFNVECFSTGDNTPIRNNDQARPLLWKGF